MVQFNILAGGFSTFIASYIFDSDANTLSLTKQSETGGNPSWLVPSPINPKVIFTVNENSPVGALESYTFADDLSLTKIDSVSSFGNGPTFAAVLSTGEVTACNFGSPNISIAPIEPADSARFVKQDASQSVVSFPRPEGSSNPHMTLEVNGEVLVPDLGADRIWRLTKPEGESSFQVTGEIVIDAGAGPRHIAMQDDVLLTLHEKTSTLTAQFIPEGPNGTTGGLLANVSIVPPNQLNGTKFAAAEIVVSEPTEAFPDRLIYVSNRNIGETIDEKGDTIAIFQLKNNSAGAAAAPAPADAQADVGYSRRNFRVHSRHFPRQDPAPSFSLELIAQVPTGLQQIRSFSIGPKSKNADEFLIAGANTNGGVSVFRRTEGGRNLELVVNDQTLQNRTSFIFV
ncbi:Lactonase, 7-bladed beta-propeller-domain-containing protein [Flagelloscypha sp. PMI_526]|nr:Lactonase, 7-bladed beta-propeller-domain-containing protein [Flagelloscypha sp. PMI_526]